MNKLGITKIEVLIVGLIIGLLGLMAVVAVSSARQRTRDAVRLSDVRQVQVGLELYFNDSNSFPVAVDEISLGEVSTICLGESGFSASCVSEQETVYLEIVPSPPTAGLTGKSSCENSNNGYCYTGGEGGYRVQFELENNNSLLGLEKGLNCATETGLEPGACSK